jgi:hypothetical protein
MTRAKIWPTFDGRTQIIKRALQPIVGNINTQNKLIAEIRRVWESLPVNYRDVQKAGIPTLIREVIRMKGHLTKY